MFLQLYHTVEQSTVPPQKAKYVRPRPSLGAYFEVPFDFSFVSISFFVIV